MMRASEPISPYSYEAPPPYVQDEAVPFQRVRNRKTMQEYDFLLNTTMDQLGNDGNDDSGNWTRDDESLRYEHEGEPHQQNDHASHIFQSVRQSQAMHELNAPRLVAGEVLTQRGTMARVRTTVEEPATTTTTARQEVDCLR
jgi:hypothetical protein